MSRSDEKDVQNTAKAQNATEFSEAQQNEKGAQDAIAKQIASNPYLSGGEYNTSENQVLSNTADVGASSTANQLQEQAERTGANTTAANATGEAGSQEALRELAGSEAGSEQQRIGDEAGYNAGVEGEQAQLSGANANAAGNALNTQQQASQQPSWLDQFGAATATGLGKVAVSGAQAGVDAIPH